MKKLFCLVLTVLMIVSLAACGSKKDKATTDNQTLNSSVLQNQPTEEELESAPTISKPAQSADGIDVDLTKLSSTMVYSEVYNMMVNPNAYIGKTVRMRGQFCVYYGMNPDGSEKTNQLYFACLISDATACCSQGIEFLLSGNRAYPDDYPEMYSEITVIGTFETYMENGGRYCRLSNAVLKD